MDLRIPGILAVNGNVQRPWSQGKIREWFRVLGPQWPAKEMLSKRSCNFKTFKGG